MPQNEDHTAKEITKLLEEMWKQFNTQQSQQIEQAALKKFEAMLPKLKEDIKSELMKEFKKEFKKEFEQQMKNQIRNR